jgi:hypothetical protein
VLRYGRPLGFALLFVLSCGGEDAPTDSYELSGVVTDEATGKHLSGALVTFVSDTLYTTDTRTDGDGHYEMIVETDTPFGQVRAELDGYRPGERTVFFDTPSRRIDIELVPAIE